MKAREAISNCTKRADSPFWLSSNTILNMLNKVAYFVKKFSETSHVRPPLRLNSSSLYNEVVFILGYKIVQNCFKRYRDLKKRSYGGGLNFSVVLMFGFTVQCLVICKQI